MTVKLKNGYTLDVFSVQESIRMGDGTITPKVLSLQGSEDISIDELEKNFTPGNITSIVVTDSGKTKEYKGYTKILTLGVNWRSTGTFTDIQLEHVG